MYADDMVLFDDSIKGMQNLLDEINEFCVAWKLSVNIVKSKIPIVGSETMKNRLPETKT